MNYEADLMSRKTVDLRKEGARLGIAGASRGKKADLVVAIAAKYEADRLEQEAKAKAEDVRDSVRFGEQVGAAKSTPGAIHCTSCATRKPGQGSASKGDRDSAKSVGLCIPCYEFGGWENTHSDNAHDSLANGGADAAEFSGGQETIDSITAEMKHCWVCHPELDESSKTYVPRAGTSRAGMKMNVTGGQNGIEKAEAVQKALGKRFALKVTKVKGRVVLDAAENGSPFGFSIEWDSRGRFQYGPSTVNVNGKTRKVRNVSELLRLAG